MRKIAIPIAILLWSQALRAGLDETEVTSGIGFKWPAQQTLADRQYSLDYAFAYHDAWKGYEDLGIAHRFGLTVKFK